MSTIHNFLPDSLLRMNERLIKSEIEDHVISLDKNELPFEISKDAKQIITEKLIKTSWNRYPSAVYPELETHIAKYTGAGKNNIVIGTGAAQLIEMLFNLLSGNDLIVSSPSFSLFEYLCKTYGISYKHWKLNQEMEYDFDLLPQTSNNSVVVLASPNNPTGTIISRKEMTDLLTQHPKTLFIVDEAYSEFSNHSNELLIKDFPNIILIRSFSKTFGLAGARAGYLICPDSIARQLKKVVLPFVLNHFAEITLNTILKNEAILNDIKAKIGKVKEERNRMYHSLKPNAAKLGLKIYDSWANFILVGFTDEKCFQKVCSNLKEQNINVLNLDHIPELKRTLRISVGLPEENNIVMDCIKAC